MIQATMQAVVAREFGGPEVLELAEVPRPEPLPTEVLVRVHAAGVNPVDAKTRRGAGMADLVGDPPFIPGWDVSGVVEAVGYGVTTLEPGDEVIGMPWFPRPARAYAEYVAAPARQFARKHPDVAHVHAAALPLAGLTAWQCLVDTAQVSPGQHVLIHGGGGGVGHLAVQIAKQLGARVTVTAGQRQHAWLSGLGADVLIDHHSLVPFEEAVDDVDVVLDLVGDDRNRSSRRSLEVLNAGGLVIAVPSGASPELQAAAAAADRGLRTSSFLVEPDGHALERLSRMLGDGHLHTTVERAFPLAGAADAHRRIESGHTHGKLVLDVTGDPDPAALVHSL